MVSLCFHRSSISIDENKIKYFSQRQIGFHLSTAWKKSGLTYGVALKGLNHNLGEYSAFGVGLDFGILAIPWENGHIGLTIQDISTSWLVWNSGTIERFKPTIISGISHTYNLKSLPLTLNAMGNFIWDLSVDEIISSAPNDLSKSSLS